MSNITLYNRIEPRAKVTAAKGSPDESVSAMTFCGDMAVFWATMPDPEDEEATRREARVIFSGMMYRFEDVPENRTAMAEFMKGPTNEQSR